MRTSPREGVVPARAGGGRRRVRAVAVLVMVAVCTTACVTRRPIAGRDIAATRVRDIVPHETTRDDVIEWFGAPDSVIQYPDGSEEYRYSYIGFRDRRTALSLYAKTTTQKEHKSLAVRLHGGVVIGASYANTARPRENVTK
jgi:predicted small secreted protein